MPPLSSRHLRKAANEMPFARLHFDRPRLTFGSIPHDPQQSPPRSRMLRFLSLACVLLLAQVAPGQDLPKMNFGDVAEIAPGVFFRFSAISATDKKVEFGGSNNIWIVFDEYVVV